MCHANIHAISEPETHIRCHHYRHFHSLCATCHISITGRPGVYWAYSMPSLNAISELATHTPCSQELLHITLHSKSYMSYGPWALTTPRHVPYPHHVQSWSLAWHMQCPLCMQFWSLRYICHAIIACNFRAHGLYPMPSAHAILELALHMSYPFYIQFSNMLGICYAIIKCNF